MSSNLPSGFFKLWTFFRCFDRDLRELKQNNKLDTDQLFYYILNIQKMCHQNQPSGFFKVWTFFRCFDRDLRELEKNNKSNCSLSKAVPEGKKSYIY